MIGGESSNTREEGRSREESISIGDAISRRGLVDWSVRGFLNDAGSRNGHSGSFHFSLTKLIYVWLWAIEDKIGSRMIPCGRLTGGVDSLAVIFDETLTNLLFFFFLTPFFSSSLSSSAFFGGGTGSGMEIDVRGIIAIGFLVIGYL